MRFVKALVTTALLAMTATAYAQDTSAMTEAELKKQKPKQTTTLAQTLTQKDLAECGTSPCPPKLRYMGPTTISTYLEGKNNSFQVDVKECDRIAPGNKYCLYPEDKFAIEVPKLTSAQKKAGYSVGLWSKDSHLWNKQGTGIFNDYVVTHAEAQSSISTKDKLFVVMRDAAGKICASYGLDYTLDACMREAPPMPVTPKPYCGDGIVNAPGEQCDGKDGLKPGQVCLPDCTVECVDCPPEDVFKEEPKPVTTLPPIVEEKPIPKNWNAGFFVGKSESAFEKIIRTRNTFCPTGCNEKEVNNLFAGPSYRLELGYGQQDFTADFTATRAETTDKQENFGAGQFKPYFATERSVTDLNLDLTKTWFKDSVVKIAANAEGSYAKIETAKDATATRNATEVLAGAGISAGDLTRTHATLTGGYAQKDVVFDTYAPGFPSGEAGAVTVQTPVVKLDLQLSVDGPKFFGDNTFDIYGIGKHFLPDTVGNVEVKKLQEFDAGAQWMFDLGKVKLGPAVRYNQQNQELDFKNNPAIIHPTGDTTQYWGGIRINF